jgi:hypothetical protein
MSTIRQDLDAFAHIAYKVEHGDERYDRSLVRLRAKIIRRFEVLDGNLWFRVDACRMKDARIKDLEAENESLRGEK